MRDKEETLHRLLIGSTILRGFIDDAREVIILQTTDNRFFSINHHQDCCEFCYFAHINQAEFLPGATINKVHDLTLPDFPEAEQKSKNSDIRMSYGFSLETNRGTITFESRMEGNGCYAGDWYVDEIKVREGLREGSSFLFESQPDEDGTRTLYEVSRDTFKSIQEHQGKKTKQTYKALQDF